VAKIGGNNLVSAQEKNMGLAVAPSHEVIGNEAGDSTSASKFEVDYDKMSSQKPFQQLIYVRYLDHVLFNRSSAIVMQPQTREAVGWLVYDCEFYIILSWDRDADPPTLQGGDPKASGLVLLKSDIVEFQQLKIYPLPLQKTSKWSLNLKKPIQEDEYAFRPTERKTHGAKDSTRRQQV
jgi:hypothetical protein